MLLKTSPSLFKLILKQQKTQKVMQRPCLNGASTGKGTVKAWQKKRGSWRLRQWIHQGIHDENSMAGRGQYQVTSFHCRSWHKSLLHPLHSGRHLCACVCACKCVAVQDMWRRAALHFRHLIEAHKKDTWSWAKSDLFSLNLLCKMQLKAHSLCSSLTKLQAVCGVFRFFFTDCVYFALCKLKSGPV